MSATYVQLTAQSNILQSHNYGFVPLHWLSSSRLKGEYHGFFN